MINMNEYQTILDKLSYGEQINTYHCKKGRNNDRFYIRRNHDGSYVGYCHHCCEHGYIKPFKDLFGVSCSSEEHLPSSKFSAGGFYTGFALPISTYGEGLYKLGREAFQELLSVIPEQVLFDSCRDNNLGYDLMARKVYFPYYTDGILTSYQTRKLDSFQQVNQTGPKYISKVDPIYDSNYIVSDPMYIGNKIITKELPIVIVEDWFSAAHLSSICAALPLRGVNMNDHQIEYIAKCFNNIFIWLDNDNDKVRASARSIHSRFSALGKNCGLIYLEEDPKSISLSAVTTLLNNKGKEIAKRCVGGFPVIGLGD